MTIVIIAGNHDSSSRLEVTRTLWEHFNVFIIGKLEKIGDTINFDQHIIPVPNKNGDVVGYVVALPYVASQAFPSVTEDLPREKRQSAYLEALAQRVEEVNTKQLPVVMMAHMAIAGSDITGHDLTQGGMDYIPASDLKVGFDYLALGHIHCPQKIEGKEGSSGYVRYCGSPIPVSFDERYVHSVTVVEMEHHGEHPVIRTLPILNPWPLKTLPEEAADFEECLKELDAFPADQQAYIRLHVKLSDVPPHNAMERASTAVKNKRCRLCCFKWEQQGQKSLKKRAFADVDQMKEHTPLDIAELYYENKFGLPLDAEYKKMLSEVIQHVQQDHHKN